MAILEAYKLNFETLKQAAFNDDLCLAECEDRETGETVIAVCCVSTEDGQTKLVPIAKLFNGNPYEELKSPLELDAEEAARNNSAH